MMLGQIRLGGLEKLKNPVELVSKNNKWHSLNREGFVCVFKVYESHPPPRERYRWPSTRPDRPKQADHLDQLFWEAYRGPPNGGLPTDDAMNSIHRILPRIGIIRG